MHGYSARSQIAEALLREYAGDHFKVYSAGFSPKPVNPDVIKVMKEIRVRYKYTKLKRCKRISRQSTFWHNNYCLR
jgi:protein-tyrosine-phosphatase